MLVGGLEHVFIFHNIRDVILPIDFHIFQHGENHQPERDQVVGKCDSSEAMAIQVTTGKCGGSTVTTTLRGVKTGVMIRAIMGIIGQILDGYQWEYLLPSGNLT